MTRPRSTDCWTCSWPPTELPTRACLIIELVVHRAELTDVAWERTEPLLPGADRRGCLWRDHRQVIDGVL
ncbi:transposase [Streptomyces sp. S1D4-23]|nr:transposase [Streptomyces sp. RLB3-6]QDO05582.1 transposase [Streptomyces sp. S1D4-23]